MMFDASKRQDEPSSDATGGAVSEAATLDLRRLRRVDLIELLVSDLDTIEDLRANLLSTELSLSEATDMTERLKARLNEKDAQIERLKAKLDDKDAQIEHLKNRLDIKDQIIGELQGNGSHAQGVPVTDAWTETQVRQERQRDDARGNRAPFGERRQPAQEMMARQIASKAEAPVPVAPTPGRRVPRRAAGRTRK